MSNNVIIKTFNVRLPVWTFLIVCAVLVVGYREAAPDTKIIGRVTEEPEVKVVQTARQNCKNKVSYTKPVKSEMMNTMISRAYILPHPPDYLNGRYIHFYSYEVLAEAEGEKIVFMEVAQEGTQPIKTVVDADEVKWF